MPVPPGQEHVGLIVVNEFFELCLDEPIPISATHNLNVDVLLDKIV